MLIYCRSHMSVSSRRPITILTVIATMVLSNWSRSRLLLRASQVNCRTSTHLALILLQLLELLLQLVLLHARKLVQSTIATHHTLVVKRWSSLLVCHVLRCELTRKAFEARLRNLFRHIWCLDHFFLVLWGLALWPRMHDMSVRFQNRGRDFVAIVSVGDLVSIDEGRALTHRSQLKIEVVAIE